MKLTKKAIKVLVAVEIISYVLAVALLWQMGYNRWQI